MAEDPIVRARELFEDDAGNIIPGEYVFRLYSGTGVDDLQGKIIKRLVTCRECKFLEPKTFGDGEKCQEVLMAHIAVWNEETGEKWWNATNITHWMPLREPPEEGTK